MVVEPESQKGTLVQNIDLEPSSFTPDVLITCLHSWSSKIINVLYVLVRLYLMMIDLLITMNTNSLGSELAFMDANECI